MLLWNVITELATGTTKPTISGLNFPIYNHNGEVFAGFSLSRSVPPTRLPNVENSSVSGGQVQLSRTPISDALYVEIDGSEASQSVGTSAPGSAGDVVVNGDVLLFNAGDEGKSVSVQYHFEPTFAEARDITGDAPIGGDPAPEYGVVGLLIQASPLTVTNFDSSASWDGIMHPFLGANGLLTASGPGTELTQYIVKAGPTAGNPYLTLESRG